MNSRVLSSRCRLEGGHQRHLLVHRRRRHHLAVVGVIEEGLDVVPSADLLDVLLLRHHHAHNVGLGHGRVVGRRDEVDGDAVRSQERPGHGLDGGDVDGLRLQQGRRLASCVLRHLNHLLLPVRGHGSCQRPRLLLRLTGADDAARTLVDNQQRLADPLLLVGLHERLHRRHERRGVTGLLDGELLCPAWRRPSRRPRESGPGRAP
jgi:hypothetical protein